MMITADNISKKYRIYHQPKDSYGTLVSTLSSYIKKFFKRNSESQPYEEFWALRDVCFSIAEGDRLGIIGKNGAGKSTLLKILSRIVQPTTGHVKIRKRVSCLLEVGTGFHPELTGRENIYLNGAILGMTKSEIMRKFDEIVAFAEITQFLDTPVKRFSSGMHMRLGFAIAAHLDPEILIVDEVLAVGDLQFQKKCLNKLEQLNSQGRTVIFVSHDVGSVLSLCNKGMYLEKGRLVKFGDVEMCVNAYMQNNCIQDYAWRGAVGDEHIQIMSVKLQSDINGRKFIYKGDPVVVEVEYEILKSNENLILDISIWNSRHQFLARSHTFASSLHAKLFAEKGKHCASFTIDSRQFHEGEYLLKLECSLHQQRQIVDEEIILKFPIYDQADHGGKKIYKEGISLGSAWVHKA